MSKISDGGKAPRKRPVARTGHKSTPPKPAKKTQPSRNKSGKTTDRPPAKRTRQSGSEDKSRDSGKARPDNRRRAWKARKSSAGEQNRPQQKKPVGNRKKTSGFEGFAAREAAVMLLHNVLTRRRPMDELLNQARRIPELARLSKADRAFARAIAATALRRHGQLRAVLDSFMEKGLPERAGPLREILLAASAQLLFLESPPHAVLNIAVQQVKRDPASQRYDKLANAVLRRVSEKGPALIKQQQENQQAGRLNTPGWLWNAWCKSYDKQTAQYIAEAHLHQAQLDLSIVRDPELWAQKLGGQLLPTGSVRLRAKGRIEHLPGYDDGAWWVQDMAAALPVQLLGNIRGKRIADLAAAPGGKTAQLIAAGAEVTAVDSSKGRLKRLVENLERLEMDAEIIEADILQWQPDEKYDAVLLDAPCSATGTIRRHPDLPFLKKRQDVQELAQIQSNMLDRALAFLKPGGTLVYCTCSLQPEEGPDRIRALLKRHKKVKCDPIRAGELAGHSEWISSTGHLRTLPFFRPAAKTGSSKKITPGMDGFFAARLITG